jgi:hypothetical protein
MVVLGSILIVIGVLFPTFKAWEWQLLGLSKSSRVIDENGDARISEPAPQVTFERITGAADGRAATISAAPLEERNSN